MTLKLAQFCDDQKKYPQNLHTPKKYSFSETSINIEIQNFEQKKNSPSLRMCENIRVPPGLGISAPPPNTPQFSELFVWSWEGAQKCFILGDQTSLGFKIPSFTSPGHTQSLVRAPGPHFPFSFSRAAMLSQLCITVYTRNII